MTLSLFKDNDPRDKYDSVKWDFDDNKGMQGVIGTDGYYYKLTTLQNKDYEKNKLNKLEQIRAKAANIANYFHVNINKYSEEDKKGLRLFVYIHGEIPVDQHRLTEMSPEQLELMKIHWGIKGTCSNVIYSEMPHGNPFNGLNKPMERYINELAPHIGKDENLRSKWRHVFFRLSNDYKTLSIDKPLINLVIHELAHTAANHQRWRNDDHGSDFKHYENLIRDAWNKC